MHYKIRRGRLWLNCAGLWLWDVRCQKAYLSTTRMGEWWLRECLITLSSQIIYVSLTYHLPLGFLYTCKCSTSILVVRIITMVNDCISSSVRFFHRIRFQSQEVRKCPVCSWIPSDFFVHFPYYIRAYFWTFWKKLKLEKTQLSQIRKKLRPNFHRTQNLPTPLEFSCRNGDQSQKKMVF